MTLPLNFASTSSSVDLSSLPNVSASSSQITSVLGVVFAIAGAIALLMITISGFRYVISKGDPQAVAKAKDGIIYALVGLLVCILAEAIVQFVIGKI